jgi:lysophospholipase L1-like esterase
MNLKFKSLAVAASCFVAALVIAWTIQGNLPGGGSLVLANANGFSANANGFDVQSAPAAKLKWTMPDRFGEFKNGIIDYHWNSDKRTYESEYVSPESWKVNFDACEFSRGAAIASFTLQVRGELFPKGNSCKFAHEFPTLGTYPVNLIVKYNDGQTTIVQADVTVKDYLIVSVGDSFASGQGNPDIERDQTKGPAQWVYRRCHRSAKAGPALAALAIERADPASSVTFVSFACSGATVNDGLIGEQKKGLKSLTRQMDLVKLIARNRKIDALLISVGGNDAYFAKLVAKAVLKDDSSTDSGAQKLLKKGLASLDKRFENLNDNIAIIFPTPKVFITEYPDLVRDARGQFCDRAPENDTLHRISKTESQWAWEKVIVPLNQALAKAAKKHNWVYVDGIASEFFGHGYCAGENERWVRTFSDAKRVQGTRGCTETSLLDCIISPGSVHPNGKGHVVYAKRLLEEMQDEGVISPVRQ